MATPHRKHQLTSRLAAALFVAITLAPHAAGQPFGQMCGSVNYTANGTYQSNIQRLALALPTNASTSRQALFAKATLGAVPNIVYALALCRGDANASACGSCVATAFQDAQRLCAYSKDATVFYDLCLLRYSNLDFVDSVNGGGNEHALILTNTQNVTAPFKVFDDAVAALLNAIAEYAAANSSKRFGTGVEGFQTIDSKNPMIYGLAQCTPDMTPEDCSTCLSGIIQDVAKYFSGKQGGRVVSVRCNYRYEQYPFFSSTPLLQLPEPTTVGAPAPVTVTQPASGGGNRTGRLLAIILPIIIAMLVIGVVFYCLWRRKRKPAGRLLLIDSTNPEDVLSIDSLTIDLATLRATTENFDEAKKLGQGGFGAVYKGILPDGREIAVKRLSQNSRQGIKELKTELVLVAKLQHKNLVRLVGVCLENHEKLLVYEYMPNNSLDSFLFDPDKSNELDWEKRFMIINGIAQGLRYLHEESQLKIVHRDLKASNVLLDSDFNAKISDFGLARLFGSDQSQYVTNRVVGTYGYMAPEYAMRGYYSIKSDVFSFGILMLEVITGRRNGGSYDSEEYDHLLSLVWGHWTMGAVVEIMDSSLSSHPSIDQILKCIHIGLLCVQHNPADRPIMSTVNIMLSSSTVPRQAPSRPAFCFQKSGVNSNMHSAAYRGRGTSQSTNRSDVSENEVTITELEAR
ncbi:hypothetical protein HU200_034416 [Digitaria exilis]|uniref:Cysteine-rich receptor-like protein kinase 10 n=1 Tax=Digitaria exilis TaxID=1010633 RepID=A0A835BK76_9POAL|nr:hypothetical protein HU200_034416 [Digitaria exilis]